jgi:hypothetical protein
MHQVQENIFFSRSLARINKTNQRERIANYIRKVSIGLIVIDETLSIPIDPKLRSDNSMLTTLPFDVILLIIQIPLNSRLDLSRKFASISRF